MSPQGHCLSDSEVVPAGSCFEHIFIALEYLSVRNRTPDN